MSKELNMATDSDWYLFSSHGLVLVYIAINPDCTIKEIAQDMARTQRTIWSLIRNLRQANMLNVRREGRRHHYTVNLDALFAHPAISGYTLHPVLGTMAARAR